MVGDPFCVHLSNIPKFSGAVIDTGAPLSVIGRLQAIDYSLNTGQPIRSAVAKPPRFYFGENMFFSIGTIFIRLPPPLSAIQVLSHVVNADIPFLIGFYYLESLDLSIHARRRFIECKDPPAHCECFSPPSPSGGCKEGVQDRRGKNGL
jgi:hypothetical protein